MRRLLLAFGILFLALYGQRLRAQAWPTKTIKVVVPLTAGQRQRRHGADRVRSGVAAGRPVDRHREPARRRQFDRHERGRQGRSRWLHHPGQLLLAHGEPGGPRHHAARHRQRPRRHHPARQYAGRHPVQPEARATRSSATSSPGPRPIPARPIIRRPAPAIRPTSTASCSASPAASTRCTCRSRARRRR